MADTIRKIFEAYNPNLKEFLEHRKKVESLQNIKSKKELIAWAKRQDACAKWVQQINNH